MKKTMQAMAGAVLGMALAAPGLGHDGHHAQGPVWEVTITCTGQTVTVGWRSVDQHIFVVHRAQLTFSVYQILPSMGMVFSHEMDGQSPETLSGSYTFPGQRNGLYRIGVGHSAPLSFGSWKAEASCGHAPTTSTPPPAAAPGGHVAIVPSMPKALAGGEDAADHWLRISNPSAASISVTVDGRDRAGTKGGTYRRELPAYRSVRVNMRDIEAAFDVTDPEGWWTLTVAGTGPLYAVATMRQGAATRFIPVERPATSPTGTE